ELVSRAQVAPPMSSGNPFTHVALVGSALAWDRMKAAVEVRYTLDNWKTVLSASAVHDGESGYEQFSIPLEQAHPYDWVQWALYDRNTQRWDNNGGINYRDQVPLP